METSRPKELVLRNKYKEIQKDMDIKTNIFQLSIEHAPKVNLKPLPAFLRNTFLELDSTNVDLNIE